jgi:hypothetical protein
MIVPAEDEIGAGRNEPPLRRPPPREPHTPRERAGEDVVMDGDHFDGPRGRAREDLGDAVGFPGRQVPL